MKKLFYLFMALGLVFTACNPLEDINADIDATAENAVVGDDVYTLTDDDYDELGLSYGSFNSENDAKIMLPGLLSDLYPAWGKNSSVLVNYQLYVGNAFSTRDYKLTQTDYTFSGSDLLGFQSDVTPGDYLADILATNISSPSEGTYAAANYYQFTGSAYVLTPEVSLDENFDYGATDGDLITTSGGAWASHSGTANQLQYTTTNLSMASYPSSNVGGSIALSSSGSEDVNTSFSPINSGTVYYSTLINLSTVSSGTYFIHFMEQDGSYNYGARVGAMDNGSGKILFGIGASSSTLSYGSTAYDLNTTYLLVASYNIASGTANLYVLTNVATTEPNTPEATNTGTAGYTLERIGVRQGSGGPTATIDGLRVANSWSSIIGNGPFEDEVIGTKVSNESYYKYSSGTWSVATDIYALTTEDYDSMGTSSGQPGRYNNFDSSMDIESYVTTFLGIKYPYAAEGDSMNILYKYYSSSAGATQTRGNSYTVTNGEWIGHQSTISTSLQLGHDGTSWVPDNTIKYTLLPDDYDYMAAELEGNPDFANVNLANLASYDDFDYNWSEDQILYALGILADHLNPSAEEGQKYLMTYLLYDNGIQELSMSIIKQNGVWVINE